MWVPAPLPPAAPSLSYCVAVVIASLCDCVVCRALSVALPTRPCGRVLLYAVGTTVLFRKRVVVLWLTVPTGGALQNETVYRSSGFGCGVGSGFLCGPGCRRMSTSMFGSRPMQRPGAVVHAHVAVVRHALHLSLLRCVLSRRFALVLMAGDLQTAAAVRARRPHRVA